MSRQNLHFNKKLKRAVDYACPPDADGTPARALYTYDDEPTDLKFVAIVGADEAHRWIHGQEYARDKGAPSVGEMLDAIAVKLQDDCSKIMLTCSENEMWLIDLYRRAKDTRPLVAPVWR